MEPDKQWHHALASALEWWEDAGVDMLTDSAPRDWLARPAPAAPAHAQAVAAVAQTPAPEPLPATLPEFLAWRTGAAAPEAGWLAPYIAPMIVPGAKWAVMIDMPEAEDRETLWTGPCGQLLDRMLAAIGQSRQTAQLVPLAFARPLTGQIPGEALARLTALAEHCLRLIAPERLLLLGQAPSRALLGTNGWPPHHHLEQVNHFGGTTAMVASFHPRSLIERPAAKSEAWKHLLLLNRGTSL